MLCRHGAISPVNQKGQTLIEVIVALALIGLLVPLVLGGLSFITTNADYVYDRSVLFEVAQSQLEAIESQTYSENATDYTLLTPPDGYSIEVSTSPAVTYTYAAPLSTTTNETMQLVTVTVSGVRGNMEVNRYKVRE